MANDLPGIVFCHQQRIKNKPCCCTNIISFFNITMVKTPRSGRFFLFFYRFFTTDRFATRSGTPQSLIRCMPRAPKPETIIPAAYKRIINTTLHYTYHQYGYFRTTQMPCLLLLLPELGVPGQRRLSVWSEEGFLQRNKESKEYKEDQLLKIGFVVGIFHVK